MAQPLSFDRLPALRLFAGEIKNIKSAIQKKGDDQYESQLYLTPTGAKGSRVFFVGTATEIEDIASNSDSSFFRMRVADPTGVAFITAGQYQPEAARTMQELISKIPAFVAVVGKLSLYTTQEATLVSIRAERVIAVDEDVRNTWIIETAKATYERVISLKENAALTQEVDGAYQGKEDYTALIRAALGTVAQDVEPPSAATDKSKAGAQAPPKDEISSSKGDNKKPETLDEKRHFVLKQVFDLDKSSMGADMEKVTDACKRAGISATEAVDIIDRLLAEGEITQPFRGTVRHIAKINA